MQKKTMITFILEKYEFFIKNRQGAILLSFMALIPVFIGLIFLSFEFSHFIQKRAKLSDALEQASLALSTENNYRNDRASNNRNNYLVTSYAQSYLPSERFSQPRVVNTYNESLGYTEYNASLQMNYQLALLNSYLKQTPSPTWDVNENGAARKYLSSIAEPIDVVFVTDFSGSMDLPFGDIERNNRITKLDELKAIFVKLNNRIFSNDGINTIGFVPFSWGTKRISANGQVSSTYCHFPYSPKKIDGNGHYLQRYTASNLKNIPGLDNLSGIDNLAYGQLDEDKHHAILSEIEKKHRDNEIPTKTRDQAKNFLDKAYKVNQISTITKIVEEHIDYKETINSIDRNGETIDIPMDDILDPFFCLKETNAKSLNFDPNSKGDINEILNMKAEGGTLASSGILVGNKMLTESQNNNKLMIILSDGDDNTQKMSSPHDQKTGIINITQKLITEGMCQKIKDNGIKMVFIGIGYVPDNNIIDWEKDCVGTGNFYLAKNAHELEISIERALVVDDEVGRNIPKS